MFYLIETLRRLSPRYSPEISKSVTFLLFRTQEVDLKVAGLGPAKRSQRYAAIIDDGVIKVCSENLPFFP